MLPVFLTLKTAVSKLIAQGERSFSEDDYGCMYRYGGLSCVIGHMIPDEVYTPEMEHGNVYSLKNVLIEPFKLQDLTDEQISEVFDILTAAQEIHDYGDLPDWEKDFNSLFLRVDAWESSQG